jgi:hypothetical protein
LSVECLLGGVDLCEVEYGGCKINVGDKGLRGGTDGEAAFAPDDAGVVDAALIDGSFGALAVVVEKEDNGVIDLSGCFEGVE